MRCLWITYIDPTPATNGQLIYSKGLIESAAGAGLALDVLALARAGGGHRDGETSGGIAWHLGVGGERPRWSLPLSPLPEVASRADTGAMRERVRALLANRHYDAVVFDSICAGWALRLVMSALRRNDRPLALVHIAHNHEVYVARELTALAARASRRAYRQLDGIKVAALERALVESCDLSTSNTEEDLAKFRKVFPDKRIELLRPGYGGEGVSARTIGPDVPRRAIVVGSFDWPPKRTSLEDFLAAAAPVFAGADVELHIVGSAEQAYLDGLRARYPGVVFTGAVEDVRTHMQQARIAIVPDYLGGFKLKSLDYVFNRSPIFALRGAVPGVPLAEGISVRLFSSHETLARSLVETIDAFDFLNIQHEAAYRACQDAFDWSNIGKVLVNAIEEVVQRKLIIGQAAVQSPPALSPALPLEGT
jgi:glycosyltransferase involved in cell wall biosynthesis